MLRPIAWCRSFVGRLRKDGLGRSVNYYCRRLGVDPAYGRALSTGLKTLRHPVEHVRRRRLGQALARRAGNIEIPHGTDYLALPPGALDEVEELVERLQALFERRREEVLRTYEAPYGMVLTTEQTPHGPRLIDPESWAPIVEFASQPQIVGIVSRYLGEMPVLSVVTFAYTLPGTAVIGSQQFHCDMNHHNQVHLIVPIQPIGDGSGPFTFLPGDVSERVLQKLGYKQGRLTDEDVSSCINTGDFLRATGEPGSAFFVNPSRCLHYGARVSGAPRLMLILNFTCYNEGTEGLEAVYRADNRHSLDSGDPIRRALLRI